MKLPPGFEGRTSTYFLPQTKNIFPDPDERRKLYCDQCIFNDRCDNTNFLVDPTPSGFYVDIFTKPEDREEEYGPLTDEFSQTILRQAKCSRDPNKLKLYLQKQAETDQPLQKAKKQAVKGQTWPEAFKHVDTSKRYPWQDRLDLQ